MSEVMRQDTRVDGTDDLRLVEAGSAERADDSYPARGSPTGGLAEFSWRAARTSNTEDLSASLRAGGRWCGGVLNLGEEGMLVESRVRAGGRWCGGGGVLNLGEGGMLLERNSDLEVAKTVRFELCGADFRYTGHATVTHRDDGSIGLQFVTWDGDSMNRSVRALVAARLRGQELPAQHAGNLAGAHAHARDAREDQRAAVSRLSAVIDGTPGATTRRHHILNAAKHGILIDGLIRPGVPVRNAARAANGDAPSRSSRAIGVHLEPLLVPNRSRKPLLRQDSTSP